MNTPSGAAEGFRDQGLQGERTALAWGRTALAMAVNALLTLRSGWTSGEVSIVIVGMALLVAASACAGCGTWRRRSLLRGIQASSSPASIILCVTFVTFIACAAAVASLVMLRPLPMTRHMGHAFQLPSERLAPTQPGFHTTDTSLAAELDATG